MIEKFTEVRLQQGKAYIKYSEVEQRISFSNTLSWVHNVDRQTLHDYKDLFIEACEAYPLEEK